MAYVDTDRVRQPGALALTLALNGAVVAGLVAWNPSIIPKGPTIIDLIDPTVKPPPEPEPKPQPKAEPKPQQQRTTTIDLPPPTPFPTPPQPEGPLVQRDPQPLPPVTGGTGPAVDPLPPQPEPLPKAEPKPVRVGPTLDERRSELQPPYPPALERAEVEGSVTVRVRIGTDGRPLAIELVRADDPGFFKAARDWGLRNWRFKPATEDGRAVESTTTLTVRFEINRR